VIKGLGLLNGRSVNSGHSHTISNGIKIIAKRNNHNMPIMSKGILWDLILQGREIN